MSTEDGQAGRVSVHGRSLSDAVGVPSIPAQSKQRPPDTSGGLGVGPREEEEEGGPFSGKAVAG